jgi:DNA-binding beta-propeller fold protein YncE
MRHPAAVLLLSAVAIASGTLLAQEGPYRFASVIPIGGEGGWDYLTVDAQAHRLYVSHATKVVVVDTNTNKVVGEIADTPGVHGIALAPELGRGFSSNGRENKVSIFDLKTLKTLQKVATGENPDAILYEPARKEVYAFNGRGKSATVIDAQSSAVIATIPLEGKPEFAQADPKAGKVFVNIEDLNSIKVIDTSKHAVSATWPIAPGESASGMAIDLDNHRLFIGCENKLMLMIDNTNGAVAYSVPIGEGVDANAFDAATKLAFASSGGSATVTIAREESPTLLKVVQTLKTVKGARTMALDPVTHRIYLAANVSGTFSVQVYEMVKGS